MVWEANDGKGLPHERISPVNFGDYRALSQVFEDAAAWWYPQLTLTEAGHDPLRVSAVEASANFFSVLGVQPILGAGFPKSPFFARENIAVISHRLWRERFGGDPAIVGTSIALNGPLFTVVGVMPEGFQYPADTDVWHRLQWDLTQHSRGAHFMESIFRLKRAVTIEAANNELRALTKRLGRDNPSTNAEYTARAVPLATEVVGFFRRRCLRCLARRRSCWSSPARTSRACCWHARRSANARSPCARPSARAAAAWSVSSSPKACCWP